MDANQITYRNLNLETGLLLRPVLGADFIAGVAAENGTWKILPLAQVTELSFTLQKTSFSRPLQTRDQTITEHLAQLCGNTITLNLVASKQITADLAEVKNQMVWLTQDSLFTAVPISALASVALWKTKLAPLEDVQTFSEKEGYESEEY